jgi:hypothetical protein
MDDQISTAWLNAAADLGIRVVAPFSFAFPDGRKVRAEAHILDFGSPTGAIVFGADHPLVGELRRVTHWHSVLFESYRKYDRSLFVETLNDWGWFGDKGSTPAWYTGKSWSD